jgi:hypothetical protein
MTNDERMQRESSLASTFDLWRLDAWSQQSGKEWAAFRRWQSETKSTLWSISYRIVQTEKNWCGSKGVSPKRRNCFVFNAEIFAQGWFAD